MRRNVTIMAKNPFTDRVKTRLAREIGADAACGVYARLPYQTILELVVPFKADTSLTLCLLSHQDHQFFEQAFPELQITQQCSGNLGNKIHHALQQAFQSGAQQAVVIGSDLPFINWDLLDQSFGLIQEKSVVLGPSLDGGYYLVGMQVPGVNIFEDIPWSSANVLESTLLRIEESGYYPYFLPKQRDIDLFSDLEAWHLDLMKDRHNKLSP